MDVVSLLAKICTFLKRELGHKRDEIGRKNIVVDKVIIEKSRGEGSLMEQDTIEEEYFPNLLVITLLVKIFVF